MKRDFSLKPRTTGDLPPKKLEQILERIYPKETVEQLMEKLCGKKGGAEDGKTENR